MTPLRHTAVMPLIGTIWRWWITELIGCIPVQIRNRVWTQQCRWVLVGASPETVQLVAETGSAATALSSYDLNDPSDRDALVQRVAGKTLTARLPPAIALRSIITLPLAAEQRLVDAVAFDLPRRMPFQVEDIRYNFRLLNRDRALSRLAVELTVAQRVVIDAFLAPLHRLGIIPQAIEIQADGAFATPSPNLIAAAGGRRRWALLVPAGLAVFAFILGLTALFLPLVIAHRQLDALTIAVAGEKRSADEAIRLQQEIRAESQEAGFLSARKRDVVSPTKLLAALTTILPDNTWLNELQLTGSDLTISGVTASASSLIALMDSAEPFSKPSFRSPVVQDPKSGNEQFTIASQLRGEIIP